MSTSGWMRKRKMARVPLGSGALVRAAVQGRSLGQLLDLAIQALLESACADRVGIWLTEERGESATGRVVEASRGPIPEQWKHLDIATSLLREALKKPEPSWVEFGENETMPRLGPLLGMLSVLWIPLRAGDRTMGLAMVAYAQTPAAAHADPHAVRARADEAALAFAHYYDVRKRQAAADEIRSRARLSRAVLCGVAVDSILP